MSELQDKAIVCVDCRQHFTWTAGEQQFYMSKDPPLSQPKRCKSCREAKRAQWEDKSAHREDGEE